jgi:hypothetical protein
MASLLRAELLRAVSGRVLAGLLLAALVLNGLAIFGAGVREIDALPAGEQTLADLSHDLLRLGFGAVLQASLFGVLITTSEFRHGSIGRSLHLAGRPERLMAAKFAAALAGGLAFGTFAVASAAITATLVLRARGLDLVLDRESVLTLTGVFAATVLAAPWGMLLGWIVRAQTAALGGLVGYTLIAETALFVLVPDVARFLPGGAQSAIYRSPDDALLATHWGYVLFGGWIALAAAVAVVLVRRRDLA